MKLEQINKSHIITTLACFSFVIFFCPFLQTCSNENIKIFHESDISLIKIKSDTINGKIIENKDELANYYNSDLFKNSKQEYTYNFYKMAYCPFELFDIRELLNYEFYIYLTFSFVIIFSLMILNYSFKNDYFKIKKLTIFTHFFLHLYLVLLIYKSVITDVAQLKYGYYLFLINLILIIYFSNQLIRERKN
jgi:hypothetical protein